MRRFAELVADHPKAVLGLVALGTLFALAQFWDFAERRPGLRIETQVEKVLPDEGIDRTRYQAFRDTFGGDRTVYLGLAGFDVFSEAGLATIQRTEQALLDVDGVRRVLSLASAADIRSDGGDVRVESVLGTMPDSDAARLELRERVMANPMHVGQLVSEDGRATAFIAYMEDMSEKEFRDRGLDHKMRDVVAAEAGEAEVLLAGGLSIRAATSRILLSDLITVVPAIFVLMGAVGLFVFRNLRLALIPLGAILIAEIWMLGTMAGLDRPLNLVSFIVPALVLAVGFAYTVHVVSEYQTEVNQGHDAREAVARALTVESVPVLLTAATTIAGFLSLGVSRLPAIREFGFFCVVGVAASCIMALTLVPAVLRLLTPRPQTEAAAASNDWIERFARGIGGWVLARRWLVLAGGGAIAVAAVVGLTQIEVNTSFVHNLAPDNPLRVSINSFDRALGGSATLHVVVESDAADAFKEPENLVGLQRLQDWLESQPDVGSSASLADYLMVLNRAFNDGSEVAFRVPASRKTIGQFLFFLWNDQLSDFVTPRFDGAHVLVRVPSMTSRGYSDLMDRIETQLAGLPGDLRAHVTGGTAMVARTVDEIAWGQALSLSGATILIFGMLSLYLRSLRVAAIALIPNALPVLVYFGLLGLSGVTLNVITSLIACIVLGIAVDDTIHYIVRYREALEETGDPDRSAIDALETVARPITTTTIALCAGFLMLALSGLQHQVEFGWLAAVMLAFAWLVDVTFTPALMSVMRMSGKDPLPRA